MTPEQAALVAEHFVAAVQFGLLSGIWLFGAVFGIRVILGMINGR